MNLIIFLLFALLILLGCDSVTVPSDVLAGKTTMCESSHIHIRSVMGVCQEISLQCNDGRIITVDCTGGDE